MHGTAGSTKLRACGSEEAVAARARFVSSFQFSSSIAFVAVSVSTVMSRLVTHLLSSSLFSSSSVFFAISMSAVEPRLTWGGALDAWLAELNEAVGGGAEGPVAAVASLLSSIRFLPSIAFFAIPKSRMVSRLAWGKTLDARADEIGKSPGEGSREHVVAVVRIMTSSQISSSVGVASISMSTAASRLARGGALGAKGAITASGCGGLYKIDEDEAQPSARRAAAKKASGTKHSALNTRH